MNISKKTRVKLATFKFITLGSSAALLSACSNTSEPISEPEVVSAFSAEELEQKNRELLEREKIIAKREAETQDAISKLANSQVDAGGDLLPPNAKTGECYARVWVEPTYEHYNETILVSEESEKVEVIPAKYEQVRETVLVQPASFNIVTTPATYKTVTEQKLIKDESERWLVDLKPGSAPASAELLKAAADHGIDLDAAKPGMCFHEHYIPAKYETKNESVLVSEGYDVINTVPAKFRWVDKQVLVQEASTRLEKIPAKYKTVTEKVVDVPAHTIWKKGTGPIQKIDEATGEIMCLVEVPATYKTVSKRVLVSPETTRTIEIPAQYKTVKVKELVSEAKEARTHVPAKFKQVSITEKVSDVSFVWHEIHDGTHTRMTRTGNQICLTSTPAQYETVTRRVVDKEAETDRIEIPAKYETVSVTKLVTPAQERRIKVPAKYETVSLSKVSKEGFMDWRSILCETNMTQSTVMDIQRALKAKGYNPGAIDGVIGVDTMRAVNAFQADNKLPTDKYINMETVKALNVRI